MRREPLATLPSKQGLKRKTTRKMGKNNEPLATLPSKQGLKPLARNISKLPSFQPLATLPSKQGLKHELGMSPQRAHESSCYTSIKTRIETKED